jgi:hypothetical protein
MDDALIPTCHNRQNVGWEKENPYTETKQKNLPPNVIQEVG